MKPTHAIRIATLTLSDTRTSANDEGGRLLGELLVAAGFVLVSHEIVREDPASMRAAVELRCASAELDVIISTGGTGIAPRDRAVEVLGPMLDRTIDGFGEAFRRLSWDEVGPNAILSRAIAGVVGDKLVFALPGSPKAVRLAVEQLILPTLDHAVALVVASPAAHVHHPKTAAR